MEKQVDKHHYEFASYMTKARWASTWHQLDEVMATEPCSVLEIGPGAGVFTICARRYGLPVWTFDLDPELHPDCVGSADRLPFRDHSIDTVCAFQVLEHMPFETSMLALSELCRVARNAVVISLPDVGTGWPQTLTIPRVGTWKFIIRNPLAKQLAHTFNGEHYWELNKRGHALEDVLRCMQNPARGYAIRTYRVHENLYHRFFVLTRTSLPTPANPHAGR